mmetsp:Transcript_20181/g.60260  ORF Transcript_20181/g.60260 Transcript_20181/m.60260 type:complete len:91 (-) Transcript_20181:44-316(-)
MLNGHENRVFRLQFDMFKIISSSQDDNIRIWNFDTRREERDSELKEVERMLSRPRSSPVAGSAGAAINRSPAPGESEALSQPLRRLHLNP